MILGKLRRARLSTQARAINFAGKELLVTSGNYEGCRGVLVGYEDDDFIVKLTFTSPDAPHSGWTPEDYNSSGHPPGTWLCPIEEDHRHLYLTADRCIIEGEPGWEEPTT